MSLEAPMFSEAMSVRRLFQDRRFQLPYYQREYTWTRSDLMALVGDLRRRFLSQWNRTADELADIKRYAPYFLGSLVYYEEAGRTVLVDGQQRVTTLHLLLIRLCRLLREQELDDDAGRLVSLIWYERGTFTIDIDERAEILFALTRGERPIPPESATPSVRNIYDRATDLLDDFPPELLGDELRPFVDWLLNRVCVVVVEAANSAHGWEIFETINHRGAQPSPIDLLKGYLLSHAGGRPEEVNNAWRIMLTRLSGIGAQTPGEFVKDFIVGKLLDTPTESTIAEATSAFPEWIKANADRLGLRGRGEFRAFIMEVLIPLADRYASLRYACADLHAIQEWSAAVAFNHFNDMPYHLAAVLATVQPTDSDAVFHEKARLVASYLDLVFIRRTMNGRVDRATSLGQVIRDLIPALRDCTTVAALGDVLSQRVKEVKEGFTGEAVEKFGLRPDNKAAVRYILARMTAFTEVSIRHPDLVGQYLKRGGEFDIEHIWANYPKQHPEVSQQRFRFVRNQLGALLLLRRIDNNELGNDAYTVKLEVYRGQNALAASLHPTFRDRNRAFESFLKAYKLEGLFRPFPVDFKADAVEVRQRLYQRLCSIIWDPIRLGLAPRSEPSEAQVAPVIVGQRSHDHPPAVSRPASTQTPTAASGTSDEPGDRVTGRSGTPNNQAVARLIRRGALHVNDKIQATRAGTTCVGRLLADGTVELETGEVFPDITAAGKAAFGLSTFRGWASWRCERDGQLVALGDIRDSAAAGGGADQTARKGG